MIFIESVCRDEGVIDSNIKACKLGTPDYEAMEAPAAVADFRARIGHDSAAVHTSVGGAQFGRYSSSSSFVVPVGRFASIQS